MKTLLTAILGVLGGLAVQAQQYYLGFTAAQDVRVMGYSVFWGSSTNAADEYLYAGDVTSGTNFCLTSGTANPVPDGVWLTMKSWSQVGTNKIFSAAASPVYYETNPPAATVTNAPPDNAPLAPPTALGIFKQ